MDRVIPIKSIILAVIGIGIILAEPFGHWSSMVGISIAALAGYFTFQASNPASESSSSKEFSLKEELAPVEECKSEAKKSLLGVVLVFIGLLIAYLGSRGEEWLTTTVIGFAVCVVGALKTGAYIGCVSRLNNKRQGKF